MHAGFHACSRRGSARPAILAALAISLVGAGFLVVAGLRGAAPKASNPPNSSTAALAKSSAQLASQPAATSVADGAKLDTIQNTAQELIRRGEVKQAEALLRGAIAEHLTEQRLYVQLGDLLATQKRPEEAYSTYEQALACGSGDADLEFAAGTAAAAAGKLERAEEHYQASMTKRPTDFRAPMYLAQVQVKQEKLDEASANLLLAAKLNPDAAIVWGSLAEIALRQNKLTLAEQHARKARELEPRVTVWRLIEARALKREGKPEEAMGLLVGLDEAAKREPGVDLLQAECYGMMGRPKDAADVYLAKLKVDGADGVSTLQAAIWLEKSGDLKQAKELAARAQMLAVPGAKEVVERLGR
ncbi:MAG: tetratricopeptide repeat protein [Phycisphaerales bacterium]